MIWNQTYHPPEEQGKLDKRMKEKKKQLCDQYTKVVQIRQVKMFSMYVWAYATQEKDKAAGITAPASEAPQQVFMNPLESPYYHPTLNPFGAPPPGAPMMRMGTVYVWLMCIYLFL